MGRTIARRILPFVVFCCALMSVDRTSRAATTPSDVSVYVSDQFKAVALRVLTQISTSAIEKACPRDQVLCTRVAKRVAEAFAAALSNDKTGLTTALDNLFVDTSVAAALQLSVGSVLPKNPDDNWLYGEPPIVDCVVTSMAGHSCAQGCKLSPDQVGWMTALFDEAVKRSPLMSVPDKTAIAVAWKQAVDKKTVDPVDGLRALAALASSADVDRQDKRDFLLTLQRLVAEGLDNGLFTATYGYLANVDGHDLITVQTDILTGNMNYAFTLPAGDANNRATLGGCKDAATAYQAWVQARNGHILDQWRAEALQGLPMELAQLDTLVANVEACDAGSSTPALRALRRQLTLFQGGVHVVDFTNQYGVVVLAGAALIDYVRTRDATQLEKNIRALVMYGSTRVALFARNNPVPASPLFSTVQDVLRSCEYQDLEATLGLPVTTKKGDPGHCNSLLTGLSKAVTQPKASYTAEDIANALRTIESQAKPAQQASRDVVAALNVNELAQALAALRSGDNAAAERAVVRLGVDFMVNEVDDLSLSLLNIDDTACKRDTQSQSIFTGLGAACAVHVLLEGAYHPIADWYFQQGANSSDVSTVADSVYRNLIDNPALDTTPIIFNVGLGATFVAGSSDAWGNGYAAMTLLDKIGLAFYKYSWKDFRFETGPFAGGFLDALIRTATGEGTAQRYWLLGYTAGFPRMWSTDLGLELHVAAAMPFTLTDSSRYGFAMGGALVVPLNFVFQKGGQ